MTAVSSATSAAAYSAGAAAWADGPMRVYGPLADALVARSPVDLAGRTVLDHGAGTGAASAAARGARAFAVDHAVGMLRERREARPPSCAGDLLSLPFRDRAFDVVLAAFSLNHLADPAAGVREAGRVACRYLLASIYAADDHHPVKAAVEGALAEAGWTSPSWYAETGEWRRAWATVDDAAATIERGGLVPERIEHALVPFPDLAPLDLVRWRLGMAQCAAFVAEHDAGAIEARALELLGDAGPLVRSVLFIVARGR